MKANELMIGDWVQGNPCGQHCDRNNNTYYKIATLDIGNHCWVHSVCGALVKSKYDDIFSIPLTTEILEKNGFVVESRDCHGESLQYCELVDGLWIDISGENFFEGKLEYIHQLQHALRLCGIDKNIEL